MRLVRLLLIVFLGLFLNLSSAYGQMPGADTADLSIIPPSPGPNQNVTATIQTYLSDLNKAEISWNINGQTVDSGLGMKTFDFKTGPLGSKTELSVIVLTSEGYPISKKIIIYPAKVALVYEAISYTPPFYKGRAYFPYSGSARVVAIPSFVDESGQVIANSNLIFKWKDGNKLLEDSSGLGKNILSYKNSNLLPKAANISVEVSSIDDKFNASAFLTIDPVAPKVVLYQKDPLYGALYNKAVTNPYNLLVDELDLVAEPLFFGIEDADSLKYEWTLNGNPVSNYSHEIVFKRPAGLAGQASINLQVSNTVDYFQFGRAQISINFNGLSANQ